MLIRNSFLLSLGFTLFCLPGLSSATLYSTNNTPSEFSTAYIGSPWICAGIVPGSGYTPPGQTATLSTSDIKLFCGFKTPCVASVLLAESAFKAVMCSGKVIATVEIDDLESDIAAKVTLLDPNYKMLGEGTNHTTIEKVN